MLEAPRVCYNGCPRHHWYARPYRNAAAICQQYLSFRRGANEPIGAFLVRESLVHEEFVEAVIRLDAESLGISQDQRDLMSISLASRMMKGEDSAGVAAPASTDERRPSEVQLHLNPLVITNEDQLAVRRNLNGPLHRLPWMNSGIIMGVLRGWRLSADEKRGILRITKNSLDYEVVHQLFSP